jgi:putative DNA primase/helicase
MTSNLELAQAFLDALDCKASVWTFQTFDDNADRKSTNLARTYNGTLSEHWDTLTRASQNGAGVFVTINETDGQGRKTANIIRVRAVFVDTDGADIEPIRAAQPHILVESSPGNYHAYWLVSDAPLDEFKGAQKAMIEAWGTDKGVNDLPRVMRLPGFPTRRCPHKRG